MTIDLIETTDDADWISTAEATLHRLITQAITNDGRCVLGLSGGKTPKDVYTRLAQRTDIDWSQVHLFLTDERYVPRTDPLSNLHLLDATLLRYGTIDQTERCTFPDTSLPLEECVKQYDYALGELFAQKGAADLVVLGVGDDGHIASLFPPVPKEAFGDRLVLHTTTDRFDVHDRLTITLKPLHEAHRQCFLFKGEAKKTMWKEMMKSEEGPERWPMKAVMAEGETTVVIGD